MMGRRTVLGPRIALVMALAVAGVTASAQEDLRPQSRPEGFGQAALALRHVLSAPRPPERPRSIPAQAKQKRQAALRGSVCGNPAIQGKAIKSFGNPNSGCGIANPVLVRSVGGIKLTREAKIDCQTAGALLSWVERSAKPTLSRSGGGLAQIDVVASYACRTRNSRKGAKLSEHAKGHAVDVAGMRLRDGTRITVLKHWGSRSYGAAMRAMHKGACGIFGTVLGPNSDRYHQDHFHFDTARYRSGSYCR